MGIIVSGNQKYGAAMIHGFRTVEEGTPYFQKVNRFDKVYEILENGDGGSFEEFSDVVRELIPRMQNNTVAYYNNAAPANVRGTASCSSCYNNHGNYDAFQAFDRVGVSAINNMAGGWVPNTTDSTPTLTYTWNQKWRLSELYIEAVNDVNRVAATKTIVVEGYDEDNEIWENCLASGNEVTLDFPKGGMNCYRFSLNNKEYSAIRIVGNSIWSGSTVNDSACTIGMMQVYTREMEV